MLTALRVFFDALDKSDRAALRRGLEARSAGLSGVTYYAYIRLAEDETEN